MQYQRLAQYLDEHGIKRSWLARKLGISNSLLSLILRGKRPARPDFSQGCAAVLGMPRTWLEPDLEAVTGGSQAESVAHDLRNLLATIVINAELVAKRTRSPHIRQPSDVIRQAALEAVQLLRHPRALDGTGPLTVAPLMSAKGHAAPVTTPQAPVLKPDTSATGSVRVLVVEDDQRVRTAIQQILASSGHQVVAVNGATDGLQRLGEGQFDVLLTDLSLPDGSGWELAREVKRRQPTLRVVLVTGWDTGLDPQELRARGVDAALAKPFGVRELLDSLGTQTDASASLPS